MKKSLSKDLVHKFSNKYFLIELATSDMDILV